MMTTNSVFAGLPLFLMQRCDEDRFDCHVLGSSFVVWLTMPRPMECRLREYFVEEARGDKTVIFMTQKLVEFLDAFFKK